MSHGNAVFHSRSRGATGRTCTRLESTTPDFMCSMYIFSVVKSNLAWSCKGTLRVDQHGC